jgi:EAL domain-containing protein (putative c-di-GMP-specific phosphodiesterase class I)
MTLPIGLSKLRVLMLEDDAVQSAVLKLALKTYGILLVTQVAEGASGLQALAAAAQEFDLVITDLNMPGMDGIEFMRHAAARNIRGLILTTSLDSDLLDSAQALARGCGIPLLGTLTKPISMRQLGLLLSRCLDPDHGSVAVERKSAPRLWTKPDIVRGLDLQQFVPFFQPKFDLKTNRLVGVEILTRWNHPQHAILPPSQFIELMEDEGLIDRLTDTIFLQALACAKQWSDEGWGMPLALNISPRTLQNTDMPNRLLSMVREYDIAADQITIEMTETAVAANPHGVLETVTRLRMNGFNISIDDFGTGYASLQQLGDIPFTELKIDKSFISGMPRSNKSKAILESIMRLAGTLGLRTVAEGIETQSQLEDVKALGCDIGQGYLFAKPMPHAQLKCWQALLSNCMSDGPYKGLSR